MKQVLVTLSLSAMLVAGAFADGKFRSEQSGDQEVEIHILNNSGKPVVIFWMDGDGKANNCGVIQPGKSLDGGSYPGHAYEVQDPKSHKVLRQIRIAGGTSNYQVLDKAQVTVAAAAPAQPAFPIDLVAAEQSFIDSLNALRAQRGLPAMRLDPNLIQAAQWLAEHQGNFDKCDHDAVDIGGPAFADKKDVEDRLRVFGFPQAAAAEACAGPGEFADSVTAAEEFMKGWALGTTHYRPFLSKDGQVFETCGFGIARSKKHPNQFYATALFADRPK